MQHQSTILSCGGKSNFIHSKASLVGDPNGDKMLFSISSPNPEVLKQTASIQEVALRLDMSTPCSHITYSCETLAETERQ